jgi:hypothetical protein
MKLLHIAIGFCGLAIFAGSGCGAVEDEETAEDLNGQAVVIAPLLPDLVVGSFVVTAPVTLHCGSQSLSYTAVESNIGNDNAASHYLHLQRLNTSNGQWIGAAALQLGALTAGVRRSLAGTFNFYNGPCDCLPSTYSITFRLFDDGGNLVAESNENNNASNQVVVPAACP